MLRPTFFSKTEGYSGLTLFYIFLLGKRGEYTVCQMATKIGRKIPCFNRFQVQFCTKNRYIGLAGGNDRAL
jgi:hypothetical protein